MLRGLVAIVVLVVAACAPAEPPGMNPEEWSFTKSLVNGVIQYEFADPMPALDIPLSDQIEPHIANAVLAKLDLPLVSAPGLNVEKYWEGTGRLQRTKYAWRQYELGKLIFDRASFGCSSGRERYDCLRWVRIDPDRSIGR